MLFSRRQGRYVSRRGSPGVTYEDPYAPDSAAYAERNASHVTELSGGLVRVDIGEPIKRLPCERQAVRIGGPTAPQPVSPAPTVSPAAPTAAPAAAPKVPRKEHRAITRQP
jgi:hypothetical protein